MKVASLYSTRANKAEMEIIAGTRDDIRLRFGVAIADLGKQEDIERLMAEGGLA